jgi:hypothetical protein
MKIPSTPALLRRSLVALCCLSNIGALQAADVAIGLANEPREDLPALNRPNNLDQYFDRPGSYR